VQKTKKKCFPLNLILEKKMKRLLFLVALTLIATLLVSLSSSSGVFANNQFASLTDIDLRQMLDDYNVMYSDSASRGELIQLIQQYEAGGLQQQQQQNTASRGTVAAHNHHASSSASGRGHVFKALICMG
jgi:hypothetical protein